MKKFAIGCAIVIAVIGVAVVGAGIYGYMKVKSAVTQLAQIGQVTDIDKNVKNRAPYSAPASGELTESQVDKLVQVQTKVRERLGAGAAEIEKKYHGRFDKKDANVTDLPALLSAYADLAKTLVDAKKAQVDALNDAGLSLEEYRWIRRTSYRALGVPYVDMDVSLVAERVKSGQTAGNLDFNGPVGDKGPEGNVKLVEKHRKTLEDYMVLAQFGL